MSDISIAAGRLRHKMALQTATSTKDSIGGSVLTWTTEKQIWAEIKPASAREIVSGDQITQDATHIIRFRYQHDALITPSKRLTYKGRVFNIKKVINAQERNIMIEVTAIEDLNASN